MTGSMFSATSVYRPRESVEALREKKMLALRRETRLRRRAFREVREVASFALRLPTKRYWDQLKRCPL